jgi:proteasome lid subunit RPN8/RPN11
MKTVRITRTLVQSILEYSKDKHPDEMLLLLRGKKYSDGYLLYQAVFPPFMYSNWHSATYNPYHLPIDFSIIATAHSHPSGVKTPSQVDLLHPYGKFMLITGYPYTSLDDVAAFDGRGERVEIEVVEDDSSE